MRCVFALSKRIGYACVHDALILLSPPAYSARNGLIEGRNDPFVRTASDGLYVRTPAIQSGPSDRLHDLPIAGYFAPKNFENLRFLPSG